MSHKPPCSLCFGTLRYTFPTILTQNYNCSYVYGNLLSHCSTLTEKKKPLLLETKRAERKLRWAGRVVRMRERRRAYGVLVRKSERRKPLGRPSFRWEDNIKMGFREVCLEGINWIYLAGCRNRFNKPSVSIKCREFLEQLRNC